MSARTARLFVGLPLPDELSRSLARGLAGLGIDPGAWRVVDASDLHLTLRFLGATPRVGVPGLTRELAGSLAGLPAPELSLAGCGAFPTLCAPRVAWVGVTERPETRGRLEAVRRAVEGACAAAGFEDGAEGRAWSPHVTLARARRAAAPRTPQTLLDWRPAGAWSADEVVLFESPTRARPASAEIGGADEREKATGRYRALARFALATKS